MLELTRVYNLRDELNTAIQTNDLKKITALLAAKHRPGQYINLNYLDNKDGQTPLHKSCSSGNLQITKVLIENGASQHIQNHQGWFPLHLASFYGHYEIVMLLMKSTGEIKKETNLESEEEASYKESEEEESFNSESSSNEDQEDATSELGAKFSVFNLNDFY